MTTHCPRNRWSFSSATLSSSTSMPSLYQPEAADVATLPSIPVAVAPPSSVAIERKPKALEGALKVRSFLPTAALVCLEHERAALETASSAVATLPLAFSVADATSIGALCGWRIGSKEDGDAGGEDAGGDGGGESPSTETAELIE